jgi:hypothetical protein
MMTKGFRRYPKVDSEEGMLIGLKQRYPERLAEKLWMFMYQWKR